LNRLTALLNPARSRVRYYANPSTPALLPVPAMPGTSVVLNVEEL
jgi:hypothetical protein